MPAGSDIIEYTQEYTQGGGGRQNILKAAAAGRTSRGWWTCAGRRWSSRTPRAWPPACAPCGKITRPRRAPGRPRRRLAAPFLRPSPCTQSGLEYAVRVRRWGYIHAFVLLRVAEGCVCPGATGEKQDGPFLRPLRIWGLS